MKWHDMYFNGQYASDLGVVVEDQPSYIRPARRTSEVTIPGRDGTVSLLGGGGYEPVVYSPKCVLLPGADPEPVWNWLRGSGPLVLGSMPDYSFRARVSNQIPFQTIFQGAPRSGQTFTPVFTCQPFRYQSAGSVMVRLENGSGQVINLGNVPSAPLIRVWGEGSAWVTVGGQTVTLTDLGLDQPLILDSDLGNAYDLAGGKLLNSRMDGDFPMLSPGVNMVTWGGIEGSIYVVEIDPRSRWV